MLSRLKRGEDGFALVTAVALMAIMTMLLVVVLEAGNNAFSVAERNSRFTRTLGIAEAGLDAAVTQLGEFRLAANPCVIGTATACRAAGGEYQVSWSTAVHGIVTVDAIGYYPTKAAAQVTRHIQAVYEPVPSFNYAVFSNTSVDIKNGEVVYGNIFANQGVTVGAGAVVCGSVTSAGGDIISKDANIVKSYTDGTGKVCTGQTGNVWANGTIDLPPTGVIQGNATASAPAGTNCNPSSNNNAVLGGTVQGQATACGKITSTTTNPQPGTWTAPSPPKTDSSGTGMYPPYTFDPANYTNVPGLTFTCIPSNNPCDSSQTSTTAYQTFNALSKANMKGVYAVWQANPGQTTKLDLTGLTVGGDLTIVTNAPIDFGNTATISTSAAATVVLVSLYVPGASTTCTTNGGDCSIFAKNSIVFDTGLPNDPNDGIAALMYTPGKMAFKNSGNAADGALYAGSMDIKNGFRITYNSRIEKITGFGSALQQILWKEISG